MRAARIRFRIGRHGSEARGRDEWEGGGFPSPLVREYFGGVWVRGSGRQFCRAVTCYSRGCGMLWSGAHTIGSGLGGCFWGARPRFRDRRLGGGERERVLGQGWREEEGGASEREPRGREGRTRISLGGGRKGGGNRARDDDAIV